MYLGSVEKLDNDGFYKCSKIGIKTTIESGDVTFFWWWIIG